MKKQIDKKNEFQQWFDGNGVKLLKGPDELKRRCQVVATIGILDDVKALIDIVAKNERK